MTISIIPEIQSLENRGSMTLLIAVWGAIGFSLIATLVADNKIVEEARLRGVALNLDDRFKTLILVALASASVFAVVIYNAMK